MLKPALFFLLFSFSAFGQVKSVLDVTTEEDAAKHRRVEISKSFVLKKEQEHALEPLEDNLNEYSFRFSFHNTARPAPLFQDKRRTQTTEIPQLRYAAFGMEQAK